MKNIAAQSWDGAVCRVPSKSPYDKTEAFVFKREAPGFGFG
jgi:hypothetical protein